MLRRSASHRVVASLLAARREVKPIENWDQTPSSIAEAYALQNEWPADAFGKPIGYKIGASNGGARNALGLETPFWGKMYSNLVVPSGASVRAADYLVRAVEPEIAVQLGADIALDGPALTEADIKSLASAVFPVLEVVSSAHGPQWKARGGINLIADNGAHGFLVVPERKSTVQEVLEQCGQDATTISAVLDVNGENKQQGSSAAVDGGPFAITAWLLNQLRHQGVRVEQGSIISTGTMTVPWMANAGDNIKASFGCGLGDVQLSFK